MPAKIAIVGRPNVGKSTLFNALVGKRIAITDGRAGTTRDIVEAQAFFPVPGGEAVPALLLDTGGMGAEQAEDPLGRQVEDQIRRGIAEADILLMVADAKTGVAGSDSLVADAVRKSGKPCILVASKCDNLRLEKAASEFFSLGLGEPVPVSSKHRRNIDALRERLGAMLKEHFPEPEQPASRSLPAEDTAPAESRRAPGPMRLAVVGRKNAGKSTFLNRLAGFERVIVSALPGTTRDAVEVEVEFAGARFNVVDTAGLARKKEGRDAVDLYSALRTEDAIRRADVVLLFLDCLVDIGRIERHAYSCAHEHRKPLVFVVNKWDLSGTGPEEYLEYLEAKLPFARRFPVAFVSALDGAGLEDLVRTAEDLFRASGKVLTTGVLNRTLRKIVTEHQVPIRQNRFGKIYYITQTGTHPPEFTLFVNHKELFSDDYLRYVEHRLAEALGTPELPVRVLLSDKPPRRRGGTGDKKRTGTGQ